MIRSQVMAVGAEFGKATARSSFHGARSGSRN
jgi:hypothetical protein